MEPPVPPDLTSTRRRIGAVILHVVEAGPVDGPLVILLHGFPDLWWTWRRLMPVLAAAGYRVVAPDMRGYGASDRPQGVQNYRLGLLVADVIGLAAAYGRQSFSLVGHDWGGVIAWETAIRYPGSVERLVILNAPHPDALMREVARNPVQALRSAYVGFFQLPHLPEAVLGRHGFAVLKRTLKSSGPATFSAQDFEQYEEAWSQPGALTAMLNYYRALRLGSPRSPPTVTPPTLVIWGRRDRFLESGNAVRALDLCHQGQVLFLDASHWVHLDAPAAVAAAVTAFVGLSRDQLPPAQAPVVRKPSRVAQTALAVGAVSVGVAAGLAVWRAMRRED